MAVPSWAKSNATRLDGGILVTVCSGTGPSVDLARGEAIRGCKASASDMLRQSGTVRSAVYETNQDVSFQQSIEENVTFRGLQCQPQKESVEEIEAGKIQVWLQCRFDLAKASVGEEPERKSPDADVVPNPEKVHLSDLKAQTVKLGEYQTSTERIVINIASVPPCRTLTIRGGRPRVVNCNSQPAPVVISPSDHAIIIDAKGYFPKTLDLRSRKWKNHESIQVILDKH